MIPLPSLLAEVRACVLCEKHFPLGPRPVVQVHPSARVLIAGQAPGRQVHESGDPWFELELLPALRTRVAEVLAREA